jgi:hypothetical protein
MLMSEPAFPREQQGSVGVEATSEVEGLLMAVVDDRHVDVVVQMMREDA